MDPEEAPAESFLKADEVDGPATDPDASPAARNPQPLDVALDSLDLRDSVSRDDDGGDPVREPAAVRPLLSRDQWGSGSHRQSPAAPRMGVEASNATQPEDSLSLGALRKMVTALPRFEPTPYAFDYHDYSNFPEELDELFGYSLEERESLLNAHKIFCKTWASFNELHDHENGTPRRDGEEPSWSDASEDKQRAFVLRCARFLSEGSFELKSVGLDCILHIVLGNWYETAGLVDSEHLEHLVQSAGDAHPDMAAALRQRYRTSTAQLAAIDRGITLISSTIGPQTILDAFRETYTIYTDEENELGSGDDARSMDYRITRQLWSSSVILYLLVDAAVRLQSPREHDDEHDHDGLREKLLALQPGLLTYLTTVLADMRWDDSDTLPAFKLFLLYWKTTLLTFGTLDHVDDIKASLTTADRLAEKRDERPLITASPLDYHMFRQEITSKYPSFEPPPPLFPFEPESNSIVPPLQDHESRAPPQAHGVGLAAMPGSAPSIIHQPVHIATPAPSPPPSPAGPGGKGVKKQNYQTNQMFPFMYPPLEENSNSIGGKGSTEMQDLVGRKWHGRDIPTSILEAADLFADRMRATRAMKQLWKERVQFIKYERGHDANDFAAAAPAAGAGAAESDVHSGDTDTPGQDQDELKSLSDDLRDRLSRVETFYASSLPQLQSVVIVFMKVMLQTVTALVTQPNAPNGLQNGFSSPDQSGQHGGRSATDDDDEAADPLLHDLDVMRSHEVLSKAVSGTLLVLLKWFKASHVLKYEYLTQLVLDSNYIQLLLKLFTHQEPERVVNYRCERRSLNFLRFCQRHSKKAEGEGSVATSSHPSSSSDASSSDDDDDQDHGHDGRDGDGDGDGDGRDDGRDDDAAPPPIRRQTRDSRADDFSVLTHEPQAETNGGAPLGYPEVDELGNPTTQQSSVPITSYSWRNFFALINYVRVLQKVVKNKAHRQLLMVQYKYASVLRKNLKVPQAKVRLYTLKAIKGQVPYSHRKWRQGNMRIITAIYLHCRPELRDEWLAGIDVDQEMVDALPHERALRSLTYWHNLRLYPDAMGGGLGQPDAGGGLRQGEQDFFLRELERMDLVIRERGDATDPDGAAEADQLFADSVEAQRAMGIDPYIM